MSNLNSSSNHSHPTNADREHNDRILLIGLILAIVGGVLCFITFYFNIRPSQIVELTFYLLALFAAGYSCFWYLKNRKKRIEDAPIRPPMVISASRDRRELSEAHAQGAVVLGHRRNGLVQRWSDAMRIRHALLTGQPGSGKTTAIMNIVEQDLTRCVNVLGILLRIPVVIVDCKGDQGLLGFVRRVMEAAGRGEDLRVFNPLCRETSERFNPLYVSDGRYHDVLTNLFESFLLKPDFFQAHQASYFNDVGRVLYHTGRIMNTRDVMVALLDERVLREQINVARVMIERRAGITVEERENFYTSAANILQSFQDKERVPKIQGLINELNTFQQDDLSIVTGAYDGLFTFRELFEKRQVLYVSLNTNRNSKAMTAIGRMILQQLALEIGRRFALAPEELGGLPMVSVVLDEFAQIAFTRFAQTIQMARAARVGFLLAMQSIAQLRTVSEAFQIDVCSAPSTLMAMRTFDDVTARFFREATAQVRREKRVEMLEDVGLFEEKYRKSGRATTTNVLEFRAEDYTLKNLPTGHMDVLMSRDEADAQYFNLQVRRPVEFDFDAFEPPLYPKLRSVIARTNGANLRFKNDDLGRRYGCRSGR